MPPLPLTEQEVSDTIRNAVAEAAAAEQPATPPAPVASATAKPPVATPPAAVQTPKSAGQEEETETEAEDDPEREPKPNANGIVTMPFKSFKTRINRAPNKELMAMFGTTDRALIKKTWDEHREWAKEREEARRASLVTEERLKEDAAAARAEAVKERKLREDKEIEISVQDYNRKLERVADKHVDPDYVGYSLECLGKHFLALSQEEQTAFGEKESETWLKRWVKEKPKFAKGAALVADENEGEDVQADTRPEPKRMPAPNVGAPVVRKPVAVPSNGGLGEKTARPGQPNSMTREEVRLHARKHGVSM